jgi:hypothetical protein
MQYEIRGWVYLAVDGAETAARHFSVSIHLNDRKLLSNSYGIVVVIAGVRALLEPVGDWHIEFSKHGPLQQPCAPKIEFSQRSVAASCAL